MPMGPESKNNRTNWRERRGATTERAARLKLIGGLVACAIVLIAVSLVTNAAFTGKPGSPPVSVTAPDRLRQFDQLGEYLTAALASVDQLVSMLTTVQLSLFVLVGVGLSKVLGGSQRPSAARIGTGSLFLIFAFGSLTLGYAARMQMARLVWVATDSFDSVRETIAHQAFFVILSAAAAVCMLVIPFVEAREDPSSELEIKAADAPPGNPQSKEGATA
jgi:hypothetical protein